MLREMTGGVTLASPQVAYDIEWPQVAQIFKMLDEKHNPVSQFMICKNNAFLKWKHFFKLENFRRLENFRKRRLKLRLNKFFSEWALTLYLTKETIFCTFTILQRFVVYNASQNVVKHEYNKPGMAESGRFHTSCRQLITLFCAGCDYSVVKNIIQMRPDPISLPLMLNTLLHYSTDISEFPFVEGMVNDMKDFKRVLYRLFASLTSNMETNTTTSKARRFLFTSVKNLLNYYMWWNNYTQKIYGMNNENAVNNLDDCLKKSQSLRNHHSFFSLPISGTIIFP